MKSILKRIFLLMMLSGVYLMTCGFISHGNEMNVGAGYVYEDNGSNTIVAGDSRIFLMRYYAGAQNLNYIAGIGADYDSFMNGIMPVIDAENLFGKKIIIELGVNDILFSAGPMGAKVKWLSFFNGKAQQWIMRGAVVEYLLVMPSSEPGDSEPINWYNREMLLNMPKNIRMVNMDAYMGGYGFIDRLHYTTDTCYKMSQILSMI